MFGLSLSKERISFSDIPPVSVQTRGQSRRRVDNCERACYSMRTLTSRIAGANMGKSTHNMNSGTDRNELPSVGDLRGAGTMKRTAHRAPNAHMGQRALIPVLDMTAKPEIPTEEPRALYVTFVFRGVTHIRHCPSPVFYETMLTLARRYCAGAHGSLDPPASGDPGDQSGRQSVRLVPRDHQAIQ
jgi:hypothetical protein